MNTLNTISFAFNAPPRIVMEWDGATNGALAKESKTLGMRPLVVAGRSLQVSGTLDAIVESLRRAGLSPVLHVGVPPEPDLADVEAAVSVLASSGCDSVLAIGGGSVLDVAKAAAALAPFGLNVRDVFAGKSAVPETGGLPILAVPTTAGTGSEVTWVGVFTDKASGVKKASIRGGAMMPRVAFLDARLTISCPPSVTVYSGMDAFVQAVEAYTSLGATPMTDALACEAAFQIVLGFVHVAAFHTGVTYKGSEFDTQTGHEQMALGSLMAGMALNTSRLGLVHGLAHPIGAVTGASHGLICGMLLPAVIRFNWRTAQEKYAQMARTWELVTQNEDTPDATDAFMRVAEGMTVKTLAKHNLPTRLRDIGLTEADLDYVARETLPSGSTKANPRPVSYDDAREVAAECL